MFAAVALDRDVETLAIVALGRIRQGDPRHFHACFALTLVNHQLAKRRTRRIRLQLILAIGQSEVARQPCDAEPECGHVGQQRLGMDVTAVQQVDVEDRRNRR